MNRIFFSQVACLLTVVFLSADTHGSDETRSDSTPTISVSGNAEIKVAPDQAILRFAIVAEEKTLDAAAAKVDSVVKDVNSFLATNKIESQYVNTDLIRINPVYSRDNSVFQGSLQRSRQNTRNDADQLKPIGYSATRQLSVTVSDLAKLETIYKGLLSSGVNKIQGVDFRTTELRKHRDAARLKAVKAAREKATALAEELGAKLAGVQTINESSPQYFSNAPMLQNSISFAGAPAANISSIARGEISINASISVVFRLKETGF